MRLFKDEKISFEEYASAIAAIAKKNNMDLGKYPNIKKFYEVKDGEGAIRLKEAEKERNMLIDQLNKRLSKRYLEELVARTVAFNDGEISADEYYSYLLDKAKLCGIELDSMPDLAAYAKTAKGIKSIDKKALEKEFKALEDEMCGLFFRTQRERELCALDRRVYLLGRQACQRTNGTAIAPTAPASSATALILRNLKTGGATWRSSMRCRLKGIAYLRRR
jgi:hypothetical protein